MLTGQKHTMNTIKGTQFQLYNFILCNYHLKKPYELMSTSQGKEVRYYHRQWCVYTLLGFLRLVRPENVIVKVK